MYYAQIQLIRENEANKGKAYLTIKLRHNNYMEGSGSATIK